MIKLTTKMVQKRYKTIVVVKLRLKCRIVVSLYWICSSLNNKIVSVLHKIYYKTTKIAVCSSAFFPLQQNPKHH